MNCPSPKALKGLLSFVFLYKMVSAGLRNTRPTRLGLFRQALVEIQRQDGREDLLDAGFRWDPEQPRTIDLKARRLHKGQEEVPSEALALGAGEDMMHCDAHPFWR